MILEKSEFYLIPLSILFAKFLFDWAMVVYNNIHRTSITYLELLLYAVALYVLVGRFLFKYYNRSKTYYYITNLRIVIINTLWFRTVKTQKMRTLSQIKIEQTQNYFRDIIFGEKTISGVVSKYLGTGNILGPSFNKYPMIFYNIADANKVFIIVNDMLTKFENEVPFEPWK